jgi:hypothetical protein
MLDITMNEDSSLIPETRKLGISASVPSAPVPHDEPPLSVRSETGSQPREFDARGFGFLVEDASTQGSFCESERISELVGAILGDGNIYDKRPSYVELCGNPNTDWNYFEHVLLPIVKTEIDRKPKLFVRSNGLRFRINSKSFVEWLKEKGLPAGEAKARATMPDFVVADRRLLISCIRGVFDTDGSVYFDKRTTYRRPYPRIDLHMRNSMLLEQLPSY